MRDEEQVRSQRDYRQLIGWLGFVLPELVFVLSGILETPGLASWLFLESVSAYYYTSAVGAFVGILFAVGLLLLSLPGYQGIIKDRVVGAIGGFGAVGVALFPTEAPGALAEPGWWRPAFGTVHFVSAGLLLGSFALFALWLFRLSEVPERSARSKYKRRRDTVYLVCGVIIVICIALVPVAKYSKMPIFWPEAVAIKAFAISWLVKGELLPLPRALWLLRELGLEPPVDTE